MNDRPTIEQALKHLAGSVEAGLSAHPDEHLLLARKRGELSAQEADALEEHLVWCRPCAELWREIAGHEAATSEAVDPEEKRADWESLRARLAEEDSAEPTEESAPVAGATLRRRSYTAIAALLALALGGAGVWIATLSNRLDDQHRPRVNVAVRNLNPPAAAREGEGSILEIDAAETTVLVLNPRTPPEEQAYRARIVGQGRSRPVWTLDGLLPTIYGTFTIQLPPDSLAPGEYRLDLFAPADPDAVEAFHLRVVQAARPSRP